MFFGRGKRGTAWKGVATRARAKTRAEWAKAMRWPWRTTRQQQCILRPASGAQIITRAAILILSWISYEAVIPVFDVTDKPFMGNDRRQFIRGVV